MGAINGSQSYERIQKEARDRYGSELLSTEGIIKAALAEPYCPGCKPKCKHLVCAYKEEREESTFWDYALLNAVRVLFEMDPIANFK